MALQGVGGYGPPEMFEAGEFNSPAQKILDENQETLRTFCFRCSAGKVEAN